jgi:hypothetical protein
MVSEHTVKTHVAHILNKLTLRDRVRRLCSRTSRGSPGVPVVAPAPGPQGRQAVEASRERRRTRKPARDRPRGARPRRRLQVLFVADARRSE